MEQKVGVKPQVPWTLGLAIGLGIGIGLLVGREVGGDSFWLRVLVSAITSGVTALGVFGLVGLLRWLFGRK
jgi:hypothetical protein